MVFMCDRGASSPPLGQLSLHTPHTALPLSARNTEAAHTQNRRQFRCGGAVCVLPEVTARGGGLVGLDGCVSQLCSAQPH